MNFRLSFAWECGHAEKHYQPYLSRKSKKSLQPNVNKVSSASLAVAANLPSIRDLH